MIFKDIKESFFSQEIIPTDVGTFASYSASMYYKLFEEANLSKYDSFIDLGSGDGKVVFIASLFTNATGIEYDKKLFKRSLEIKKELKAECNFINNNFLECDLTSYDIAFINPDKSFHHFEEKLIKEINNIIVCNNIFLPRFLKKKNSYWVEQTPFYKYIYNPKL